VTGFSAFGRRLFSYTSYTLVLARCKKPMGPKLEVVPTLFGRVASGDCSPEAPTDPDMQIFRIRLFGSRLRYVMAEGRMRG
jgi:hypothetical protein